MKAQERNSPATQLVSPLQAQCVLSVAATQETRNLIIPLWAGAGSLPRLRSAHSTRETTPGDAARILSPFATTKEKRSKVKGTDTVGAMATAPGMTAVVCRPRLLQQHPQRQGGTSADVIRAAGDSLTPQQGAGAWADRTLLQSTAPEVQRSTSGTACPRLHLRKGSVESLLPENAVV
ncbi:hypothetical protein SKAU_G00318960 [Synaphobranchus kaupii]|uniref:Uncharacterized protein n=1 Tax=Synaphobranchus kaupii TaxID=118154 RepID=A0A9Q1IHE9_SYNKA|nr:hypothetical protein SKAU_G00318960 [Synaphobranchus kaupii]